MLRVPQVILDVVPPGLLRRDAERAMSLLQDERTCAVVLVTVPEEMPATETIELARALAPMKLRVQLVVVNCVLADAPLEGGARRARRSPSVRAASRGDAAVSGGVCPRRSRARSGREHGSASVARPPRGVRLFAPLNGGRLSSRRHPEARTQTVRRWGRVVGPRGSRDNAGLLALRACARPVRRLSANEDAERADAFGRHRR